MTPSPKKIGDEMETERYLVRQKGGGVLCCFWDILGILVESYFFKCFKKKTDDCSTPTLK